MAQHLKNITLEGPRPVHITPEESGSATIKNHFAFKIPLKFLWRSVRRRDLIRALMREILCLST